MKLKNWLRDRSNTRKTTKEIFTEIYRKKIWGGSERFYSGKGSSDAAVVKAYVDKIISFLKNYSDNKPKVVDLGCGNFEIGKNFVDYCSKYIGVDIVPDLIEKLKLAKYPENVKFLCLDITEDELPDGDICFLRQVLQHLSNIQIIKVLSKLKKYKIVFITEHYPSDNPDIVLNKDMAPGAGVRVDFNSGVYLNKPPFNIPTHVLELVLEVPGVGLKEGGIIRTYKVQY